MEHLLAPFKWIDGKIQAGVDAAAFFFMRRGVKKSFLMYSLYVVIIISSIGILWCDFVQRDWFGMLITLYMIFLLFFTQKETVKIIEISENIGMPYPIPYNRMAHIIKFLLAFYLVFSVVSLAGSGKVSSESLLKVYSIVFCTFYLLVFYLMMTPNKPPPKKKEVKVKQNDLAYQSI